MGLRGPQPTGKVWRKVRTVSFTARDDYIAQKWLKTKGWKLSELVRTALIAIKVLPEGRR